MKPKGRTGYSKYGNLRSEIDGRKFDSRKEANRYSELKILEAAGRISELELQKPFLIQEGFEVQKEKNKQKVKPMYYVCDFYYYDHDDEGYVVEDVKGVFTDIYRIKKKLFLKKYGETYIFREV
jgi:hypothetical protein